MKGEARMSSRRTSKCSPADLLEGTERKKEADRDGINAAASNLRVQRNDVFLQHGAALISHLLSSTPTFDLSGPPLYFSACFRRF